MDSTIYFGKVYIIEWLAADDAKTGWELYDVLEPMAVMAKPPVKVDFKRVTTRDEFIAYLRSIQDDFRETKLLPLLHIETHGITTEAEGGPHGIGSSHADSILWPEFMQELIPLNQITRLRLFVVLAGCEGLWGMQMLQPTERAACLVLLGPDKTITAGKLATAMQAFYQSMFAKRSGDAAFKAINDAVDPTKTTFGMVNAEMAFRWVYGGYLRERCTEAELAKRVDWLVAENIKKFREDCSVGMWKHEVEAVRAMAWQHVRAHDEYFDALRRDYFFIDLFPENDQRFPVTLADCLKED